MFAFLQCCECDASKKGVEQIDINQALDEGMNPADLVPSARVNGHPLASARPRALTDAFKEEVVPSTPSTRSNSDGQSTRSLSSRKSRKEDKAKSMTEEQKLAEKARLQAMVKSFTRDSLSGLSCKIVDIQHSLAGILRKPLPGTFVMDKTLTKFVVKRDGKEELVSMVDVVDLHSFEDLLEINPTSQIPLVEDPRSYLREEDQKSAVFIQYQPSGKAESWLCLVVADADEQERFISCIKILSLHAQARAQSAA
jgi:hypothetical protein